MKPEGEITEAASKDALGQQPPPAPDVTTTGVNVSDDLKDLLLVESTAAAAAYGRTKGQGRGQSLHAEMVYSMILLR